MGRIPSKRQDGAMNRIEARELVEGICSAGNENGSIGFLVWKKKKPIWRKAAATITHGADNLELGGDMWVERHRWI